MRNLFTGPTERWRNRSPRVKEMHGSLGDAGNGVFSVPSPIDGAEMHIVASNGLGWDHVSVSRHNRCPNWVEMEHVKRAFFEADETAIEFHVPSEDHISFHEYCLHLWRPNDGREIPRPPAMMVGPQQPAP